MVKIKPTIDTIVDGFKTPCCNTEITMNYQCEKCGENVENEFFYHVSSKVG